MIERMIIPFSKFAGVGAICASFSLSANFILLKYVETPLLPTYVSIHLISISLSFVLNSHVTYKSEKNSKNLIAYYLVYMTSMLLGVALLHAYQGMFEFENWVYPFLVTPFTMIWNFAVASRILKQEIRVKSSSV